MNTHELFDTVNHEHLDSLVYWATGDFPGSGLMLIECADGRWFIEVEFGDRFNAIEGISKPAIAPYKEPTFFFTEDEARQFAFHSIKRVYPILLDRDLNKYYSD